MDSSESGDANMGDPNNGETTGTAINSGANESMQDPISEKQPPKPPIVGDIAAQSVAETSESKSGIATTEHATNETSINKVSANEKKQDMIKTAQEEEEELSAKGLPPVPIIDEATMKARAAAARAYALSGTSSKKKSGKAGQTYQPAQPQTSPHYSAYSYGGHNHPPPAPTTTARASEATSGRTNAPAPSYYHPHHHHPHYPYAPPPPPHAHAPPHYPYYDYYAAHPPHYGHVPYPYPHYPPPPASTTPPRHTAYEYPHHHHHNKPAGTAREQVKASVASKVTDTTMQRQTSSVTDSGPVDNHRHAYSSSSPGRTWHGSPGSFSMTSPLSASARLAAAATSQPKTLPGEIGEEESPFKPSLVFDDENDDYARFVRSLLGGESSEEVGNLQKLLNDDDDDEEDFLLTNLEDEEDDDDDDDDDDGEEEEDKDEENSGMFEKGLTEAGKKAGAGTSDGDESIKFASTAVKAQASTPKRKSLSSALDIPEFDPGFYQELEDELGGLEEEDLEAAVASLLGTTSTSYAQAQKHDFHENESGVDSGYIRGDKMSTGFTSEAGKAQENSSRPDLPTNHSSQHYHGPSSLVRSRNKDGVFSSSGGSRRYQDDIPPTTPLRQATGMRTRAMVTPKQVERLHKLLNSHYQILLQQAVLAIQAAHISKAQRYKEKGDFLSGESADDLIQVLDAAAGMLQDLDQNRKDAIRNAIQLEDAGTPRKRQRIAQYPVHSQSRLLREEERNHEEEFGGKSENTELSSLNGMAWDRRRLTRAAFTKTLQQQSVLDRKSVFSIKGLHKLQETFQELDRSVGVESVEYEPMYTEVCRKMLKEAGADFEESRVPGNQDLSDLFSTPQEYLGDDFEKPCDEEQGRFLRRFRNLFTSGEDNLVLRGVNLYGEKQWILIADRYLPDRSVNNISQRYSKLCVMLYKANGVKIDNAGNLEKPPKLEGIDDIDDEKVALIKKASAPAILNVHRWSLEEDLTLLRAVPLMGHMWAELGARLIPHRDRGHLRKRYQVLERRVKATISRSLKGGDPIAKFASRIRSQAKHPEEQEEQNQPLASQQQLQHEKPPQHPQSHSSRKTAYSSSQQATLKQKAYTAHPHVQTHTRRHQQGHALQKSQQNIPQKQPQQPARQKKITQANEQDVPQKPSSGLTKHSISAQPGISANQVPRYSFVISQKQGQVKQSKAAAPIRKRLPATAVEPINNKRSKKGPLASASSDTSGSNPDSSRAAFEKLIDGGSEWSQMSRMKDLMENEVESDVVGTLANRLSQPSLPENESKQGDESIITNVLGRGQQGTEGKPNITVKRKNILPTTKTSTRLAASKASPQKNPPALSVPPTDSKALAASALKASSPSAESLFNAANGNTLDGLKFDVLESHQGVEAKDANDGQSLVSPSKLSLLNDDLEAISALNSLSGSSPAPPNTKSDSKGREETALDGPPAAEGGSAAERNRKGGGEEKSFFAKIIGGVKERDSRRKKRLNF